MTRGKTDEDDRGQFLEWLALTPIYIGYDRYDRLNGYGYVVAVARDRQESEELRDVLEHLSGGDREAADAADWLKASDCYYACDPDPAVAMQRLIARLRDVFTAECS